VDGVWGTMVYKAVPVVLILDGGLGKFRKDGGGKKNKK
jgi:hypothetical protein